jgi:uncharacterized protein CbrC (UPF0167 family)
MTCSGDIPERWPSQALSRVSWFAAWPIPSMRRYPGGDRFEPWQDHEWPYHCEVPARFVGEVGERELVQLSGGDVEALLLSHDVYGGDPPITLDMIPPHAPAPGESWDMTLHHFQCTECGWDLVLFDAS